MKIIKLSLPRFLFLLILPALLLSGCNNDVFIKPLTVSAGDVVLDQPGSSAHVEVSDGMWYFQYICTADGNTIFEPDFTYSVDTPFEKYYIRANSNGFDIVLDYLVGNKAQLLAVGISNGADTKEVKIRLEPSALPEIVSTQYNLTSWSGYPDEDYNETIYEIHMPLGVESGVYNFAPVTELPAVYRFISWNDSHEGYIGEILDSGINVPVPSHTPGKYPTWQLLGLEVPLSQNNSPVILTDIPATPSSIEVPRRTPVAIMLECDYEELGFECTITARNPVSGSTVEIACEFRILTPQKIYARYKLL